MPDALPVSGLADAFLGFRAAGGVGRGEYTGNYGRFIIGMG